MKGPGDTTPETHRVHIELMRRAPAWRKLELAAELAYGPVGNGQVPLPTPIDVVLAVVAVLEHLGVRYAVGDSFASSLHGARIRQRRCSGGHCRM